MTNELLDLGAFVNSGGSGLWSVGGAEETAQVQGRKRSER